VAKTQPEELFGLRPLSTSRPCVYEKALSVVKNFNDC
jgi:hypothetical protein